MNPLLPAETGGRAPDTLREAIALFCSHTHNLTCSEHLQDSCMEIKVTIKVTAWRELRPLECSGAGVADAQRPT